MRPPGKTHMPPNCSLVLRWTMRASRPDRPSRSRMTVAAGMAGVSAFSNRPPGPAAKGASGTTPEATAGDVGLSRRRRPEASAGRCPERQGEVACRIGPPAGELEPGSLHLRLQPRAAELGADLGSHLLAGRERDPQIEIGHRDDLIGQRAQLHRYPRHIEV